MGLIIATVFGESQIKLSDFADERYLNLDDGRFSHNRKAPRFFGEPNCGKEESKVKSLKGFIRRRFVHKSNDAKWLKRFIEFLSHHLWLAATRSKVVREVSAETEVQLMG